MVRAGAPSITCSSFVNIQGVGVCKSHLLNIRDFSVIAAFVKKLPFEMIECLHESSKKYTNGTIEELVLERKKIGEKQIFRVTPLLEYKVIISLPVAESLLRRRFYGIGLKRVKVI